MAAVKCLSCLARVMVPDAIPTLSPGIVRIHCPLEGRPAFGSLLGQAAPVAPMPDLIEEARRAFPDASVLAPDPPEIRRSAPAGGGTIPEPDRTGGKEQP